MESRCSSIYPALPTQYTHVLVNTLGIPSCFPRTSRFFFTKCENRKMFFVFRFLVILLYCVDYLCAIDIGGPWSRSCFIF